MAENILIPLPGFDLPADLPWRSGFVALVNDQLRKLRSTGHFLPPRFFGYHFRGETPVGVAGAWTVSLDPVHPMSLLTRQIEKLTGGKYSIVSNDPHFSADYILIQDRRDSACWLWSFDDGLRFIEAHEAVTGGSNDEHESQMPDMGKGI